MLIMNFVVMTSIDLINHCVSEASKASLLFYYFMLINKYITNTTACFADEERSNHSETNFNGIMNYFVLCFFCGGGGVCGGVKIIIVRIHAQMTL